EPRTIRFAARPLVEQRANEQRRRIEELDVPALDVFPGIAYVDVKDAARRVAGRRGSVKGSGERGEQPKGSHARRRLRLHVEGPGHALPRLERTSYDRSTDLLTLEHAEALAPAPPDERAGRPFVVNDQHESAIGADDLDDDVETILEHGVPIEH